MMTATMRCSEPAMAALLQFGAGGGVVGGRDKGETRAGDGVARFMAMGWDLEGSVDRGSF